MLRIRFYKALALLSGFVFVFGTLISVNAKDNPEGLVGNYYELPAMVLGSKSLEHLFEYSLKGYSKEQKLSHAALELAFDSSRKYLPHQSCFLDTAHENPIVYERAPQKLVVQVLACSKVDSKSPMFKVRCLNGKFKDSHWWISASSFGISFSEECAIEVSAPEDSFLVAHY